MSDFVYTDFEVCDDRGWIVRIDADGVLEYGVGWAPDTAIRELARRAIAAEARTARVEDQADWQSAWRYKLERELRCRDLGDAADECMERARAGVDARRGTSSPRFRWYGGRQVLVPDGTAVHWTQVVSSPECTEACRTTAAKKYKLTGDPYTLKQTPYGEWQCCPFCMYEWGKEPTPEHGGDR